MRPALSWDRQKIAGCENKILKFSVKIRKSLNSLHDFRISFEVTKTKFTILGMKIERE